jgi:O-antigen ligase
LAARSWDFTLLAFALLPILAACFPPLFAHPLSLTLPTVGLLLILCSERGHSQAPLLPWWVWVLFLLVPLLAFLPPEWVAQKPRWRTLLAEVDPGVLTSCSTPQPGWTAGQFFFFASALAQFHWLATRRFACAALRTKNEALSLLLIGLVLFGYGQDLRWESGAWRGAIAEWVSAIFPSRNQAAFVGAALMVLSAANAGNGFAQRSVLRWALGLLGFAAGGTVLFGLGSRGAWLAAAAGVGAWLFFSWPRGRRKAGLSGWRLEVPAMAAGACALLLLLLVLWAWVLPASEASRLNQDVLTRWEIQKAGWQVVREHPWTGIGLGSHAAVFAFYYVSPKGAFRHEHPESDVLRWAGETGWTGLLLLLVLAGVWTGRCWQAWFAGSRTLGSPIALSLGLLVAAFVHGLADVPLQPQASWFILVAGAAGLPLAGNGEQSSSAKRGPPWQKIFGVLLLVGFFLMWWHAARAPTDDPLSYTEFLTPAAQDARGEKHLREGKPAEAKKAFELAFLLAPRDSRRVHQEMRRWRELAGASEAGQRARWLRLRLEQMQLENPPSAYEQKLLHDAD